MTAAGWAHLPPPSHRRAVELLRALNRLPGNRLSDTESATVIARFLDESATSKEKALEEVEAAAERAWTAYYSGQRLEAAMSLLCSALHHARRVRQ